MDGDFGVAATIVGPVVHTLAELGWTATVPLPAETGTELVAGSLADSLLDAASRDLADPTLGLSMARRMPIGRLGDLDYALCTSSTLREGLRHLERFYGLVTQRVKLALVEAPPRAMLRLERRTGVSHSRHWIEFSFAMMAERIRQTLGHDVAFDEVSFAHSAPPSTVSYGVFFGAPVRFGATEDRLGFASDLLDRPLSTASAALASVLTERMQRVELTLGASDALADRARVAIGELLDVRVAGLAATASRLGMTTRTLQRALQKSGTSHKDLLDEARRGRAQHLLARGHTVREVAKLLAFGESSAFFRAFRRWTGTSPRAI
jgi:AraC-like DNA-binding protein